VIEKMYIKQFMKRKSIYKIMLESYIFRQISAKLLPKTKSSTIVET